jgi:hypothetical protein
MALDAPDLRAGGRARRLAPGQNLTYRLSATVQNKSPTVKTLDRLRADNPMAVATRVGRCNPAHGGTGWPRLELVKTSSGRAETFDGWSTRQTLYTHRARRGGPARPPSVTAVEVEGWRLTGQDQRVQRMQVTKRGPCTRPKGNSGEVAYRGQVLMPTTLRSSAQQVFRLGHVGAIERLIGRRPHPRANS